MEMSELHLNETWISIDGDWEIIHELIGICQRMGHFAFGKGSGVELGRASCNL